MQLFREAGLPAGVINVVTGAARGDRQRLPRSPGPRAASTSPARRRCSSRCGGASARTSTRYRELPAPRRRDRRQGLRLRARQRRRSTRSPSRSCAAPSSSRGRSARPPRAPTSRGRSGRSSSASSASSSPRSRWATSPTSGTSWAPSSTSARSTRLTEAHRAARKADTRAASSSPAAASNARTAGSSSRRVIEVDDPQAPAHARGALRAGARPSSSTPTRDEDAGARARATRATPYALTGAIFAQRPRASSSERARGAPLRGGQLLHQRQADGRRRRAAALRRRARVGHQRQGRQRAQPARWASPRTIKETFVPPHARRVSVPRRRVTRAHGVNVPACRSCRSRRSRRVGLRRAHGSLVDEAAGAVEARRGLVGGRVEVDPADVVGRPLASRRVRAIGQQAATVERPRRLRTLARAEGVLRRTARADVAVPARAQPPPHPTSKVYASTPTGQGPAGTGSGSWSYVLLST